MLECLHMNKIVTIVNNSKVSYWVHNPEAKKTVIVVHGFRGNHRSLLPFVRNFNQRVILLDVPGYGESEPMKAKHTIENFAKYIGDFADHIGIEKYSLIGHSYGASICVVLASMQSSKLQKLVLINPAVPFESIFNNISDIYTQVARILPKSWRKTWLSNPIFDTLSAEIMIKNVSPRRKKQLIASGRQNLKETNPEVVVESLGSYRNTNIYQLAEKITVPTLIIAGRLDPLAPLSKVKILLNKISDSSMEVIEDHGHLVPLEVPQTTASLSIQFLERK